MESAADAELLSGEADVTTESEKPPYPPSWVNRVNDWVKRLPIPAWLFYLALGLALTLLHAAVKWGHGSYPADTSIAAFYLMTDLSPVIVIAMIYYFDEWAEKALATFRPAMDVEEAEYERLRYQLTTLPRGQTLIVSFIGVAFASIYLVLPTNPQLEKFELFTPPLAIPLDVTVTLLDYLVYSIVIYHTVHQLRMVSRIYAKCTHIDLFQLSPLYAFSTLAARIAISIGLLTYAWTYVFSTSGSIVETLIPLPGIPLLFAAFILPLMGIHRILLQEKATLQSENVLHLKATIAELHRRTEAGDYGQIDGVSKAIDALTKEQSLLDKIPTWPWQPETVRWVGTALLLPVILTLATRLLQHYFGF